MKQYLEAYLIRDNKRVLDLPTEEILVALEQLRLTSIAQERSMFSDKTAVYQFFQAVKLAMRAAEHGCRGNIYEASGLTYYCIGAKSTIELEP
jgi:hypothetical protein